MGVFTGPVAKLIDQHEGRPWDLPDLHFAPDQYVTEVERASRDGSWETPRRRAARLLREHLEPIGVVLPPDLELAGASPAWNGDGVTLMFQHVRREPRVEVCQQLLRPTSAHGDPEHTAEDMAEQLLSTFPHDWVRTFGWKPPGRAASRER